MVCSWVWFIMLIIMDSVDPKWDIQTRMWTWNQGSQLTFVLTVPVPSWSAKWIVPNWTWPVPKCKFLCFWHPDMGLGYFRHYLINPYSRGAQINIWISMWIHTQENTKLSCLFCGGANAIIGVVVVKKGFKNVFGGGQSFFDGTLLVFSPVCNY